MHKYYNPNLSEADRETLDWENWVTVNASRAAAGAITRNMLAIVVHPGIVDAAVAVEFVLRSEAFGADNEAIGEFAEDLDLYLDRRVEIKTATTVDREWMPNQADRLVFLARSEPLSPPTNQVVIGTAGGRSVRFRSRKAPQGTDAYAGSSFMVDLEASGMSATQSVFMFGFTWDALTEFFDDLSDSWRGWEGIKEWQSIERHLTIRAESDMLGHCFLSFAVEPEPDASWRSTVDGLIVNLGEDMTTLASTVRQWATTEGPAQH